MDFSLTREQEMLKKVVRDFAETKIAPRVMELDARGEFETDLFREIGKLGLLGLTDSKEYGGSGMGHVARMAVLEEIARISPSFGFSLDTAALFTYALDNYGNEAQKRKYLAELCAGTKIGALAVTEPGGGSDLGGMQTTATAKDGGYVINGRKSYISHGGVADMVGVFAKGENGFSVFIVEKGTPGFESPRREKQVGFRTVHVDELALTNCWVPKENLLGAEGKGTGYALTSISVIGRTGAAAVAVGTAQGAYEAALKFAKERVLYGKPITNLQSLQFALADMNTEIEAARWLVYRACWLIDQSKNPRELGAEIAKAKLFCVDTAVRICTKAVQMMGGYGLSPEYRVERHLRDSLELMAAAGTQEVMRLTIGSSITR